MSIWNQSHRKDGDSERQGAVEVWGSWYHCDSRVTVVVFLQYIRHESVAEQSLQRKSKKSLVFVSLGIINISIVQVSRAKLLSRGFLLLFYLVYSS